MIVDELFLYFEKDSRTKHKKVILWIKKVLDDIDNSFHGKDKVTEFPDAFDFGVGLDTSSDEFKVTVNVNDNCSSLELAKNEYSGDVEIHQYEIIKEGAIQSATHVKTFRIDDMGILKDVGMDKNASKNEIAVDMIERLINY